MYKGNIKDSGSIVNSSTKADRYLDYNLRIESDIHCARRNRRNRRNRANHRNHRSHRDHRNRRNCPL